MTQADVSQAVQASAHLLQASACMLPFCEQEGALFTDELAVESCQSGNSAIFFCCGEHGAKSACRNKSRVSS